jgi:hypothetical protein
MSRQSYAVSLRLRARPSIDHHSRRSQRSGNAPLASSHHSNHTPMPQTGDTLGTLSPIFLLANFVASVFCGGRGQRTAWSLLRKRTVAVKVAVSSGGTENGDAVGNGVDSSVTEAAARTAAMVSGGTRIQTAGVERKRSSFGELAAGPGSSDNSSQREVCIKSIYTTQQEPYHCSTDLWMCQLLLEQSLIFSAFFFLFFL